MTPSSAPQPQILPATKVVIEIDRDELTLSAPDVEIYSAPHALDPSQPRQVEWTVPSALLPDELVLIFGKPLEWSGTHGPEPDSLPLVENPFCSPFTLTRSRTTIHSGPAFGGVPDGIDAVGWMYGILLVRGNDTPLLTEPMIKIVRA